MRILQILFLIGFLIFLLFGIPLLVGALISGDKTVLIVAVALILAVNIALVARYLFRAKTKR